MAWNGGFLLSKWLRLLHGGKFLIGHKQSSRYLLFSKCKFLLFSKNCRPDRRAELEYLAMISKSYSYLFNGDNIELAVTCGISLLDINTDFF